MAAVNNEYRDRLFTFIFGSHEHREWTLSLYNAVNGSGYDNPEVIELNTIEDVLYLSMHNDVSFIVADEMNMYEQQSTYNPNMPLRMLQYASGLYEKHVRLKGANKFGDSLIALPAPRLVVFYNGVRKIADEVTLRLSDAFPKDVAYDIEVRVRMINVNEGQSPALLEACRPLREYSWTVEQIRENIRQRGTNEERARAIGEVIDSMPDDFVIKPYLAAHKAEVIDMLLTEYNEAEAMELFRKDGEAIGEARGEAIGEARGEAIGEARGIQGMVSVCRSFGASLDDTVSRVADAMGLTPEQARERVAPYWV